MGGRLQHFGVQLRNRITELRLKKGVSEYQMSMELGQNRSHIPVSYTHLEVYKRQAEQVKGGEVRQFPELVHGGEVTQISRRAPEPQLLQMGMDNSQFGQIKVLQLNAMQHSPRIPR